MSSLVHRPIDSAPNVEARREHAEDTLLVLTFALYFLQGAVLNATEFSFDSLGLPGAEVAVAIIVYLPMLVALLSRFTRGGRIHVGSFIILYGLLAIGFLITAAVHADYVPLMLSPGWPHNIFAYVFSPLAGVFTFLIVRIMDKPQLIVTALAVYAYLNFVYGVVRFLSFLTRGYWTGYSFTGEEQRLSYSLGFGYDILASVILFGLLAFTGPRRFLHCALTVASLTMIAVAGSRGPLLFAIIGLTLLLLFFGVSKARTSPLAAVGLTLAIASATTFVALFSQVIDGVARILRSAGLNSRSVEALAQGEFGDDNGRSKIWEMAIELISEGRLFGHGFYGDRVVISERFFWGYPHNIALEFLVTFGPILGTIALVTLSAVLVQSFVRAPQATHRYALLLFFIMSLQLLISSSYLLSPWFWGLLGIMQISLRASRRASSNTAIYTDPS